jgi:hypothetical protein
MKKFSSLFTLLVTFLSGNVYSQSKLGITAGATVSSYKIKAESVSVTSKGKPGVTIGVFADLPLGSSGSFMPALNFVQKGGTLKAEDIKSRLTTNFLEVPLNFVYNAKLSSGKFFIGAGPSLNFGISGKSKWDSQGSSDDEKVKFGKDQDFKRFDAGLNLVTGYAGKSGMLITFNYNAGLSNSVDPGDGDGKFYNRYYGLRIGCMF